MPSCVDWNGGDSVTTQANCMTCKHRSHDAERLMVCGQVYNLTACWECHTIAVIDQFKRCDIGMRCGKCGHEQRVPIKNEWREGYLGNPVGGMLTPIPCCPGWEAEEVVVVKVERQRGLFD